MREFEAWSLIIAGGAAVTNIVVFGVLLLQLSYLRRQIRQAQESTELDHGRRRRQATIEFYATTLDRLQRLREDLPHDRDSAAVEAVTRRALSGDDEANKKIAAYLTMHNLVAVSVRSDVFDVVVIDHLFGGRLLALVANYGPWIEHTRRQLSYPTMYSDLEWLADQIAARRAETPPLTSADDRPGPAVVRRDPELTGTS